MAMENDAREEQKEETQEITENYEDDAREEDIVKDEDADTRDIEEENRSDFDVVMDSIKRLTDIVDGMGAKLDKLSSAQDVLATNARIIDSDYTPIDEALSMRETDNVPDLKDFDLSID